MQDLLEENKSFSFIQIGNFEFALLEDGKNLVGNDTPWEIDGTELRGSAGLDGQHREDLFNAIREAYFVDFLDLNWPKGLEALLRYRSIAKAALCRTK